MNINLQIDGKPVALEDVARKPQELSFTFAGKAYAFRSRQLPDGSELIEREIAAGVWQRMSGGAWQAGRDVRRVQLDGIEAKVTELVANVAHATGQADLSPVAPMSGLVQKILVKSGERVKQGHAMIVMEAMKVQITLSAGGNATVDKVLVREGEVVAEGSELVRLTALKAGDAA
ncbi:MAG: acetyl-CoA carboxylase biotin carboxyl carrier protein subunit [Alphaproteobacteria bacterium]